MVSSIPQVTTCDQHDKGWLSDVLLDYYPMLGRGVCDQISSFVVIRYNSDMNEKKYVNSCYAYDIECTSLCPYYQKV